MLLYIDFEYALSCIGDIELENNEKIIPSQVKLVANNLYKKGYEWLFSYERKLARFLDRWLHPYRDELYGSKGIISESLSNAFVHGNKRDMNKEIVIDIHIGTIGLVISIADQGKGFNINALKERHKKGKRYYMLAGNGTHLMFSSKNLGFSLVKMAEDVIFYISMEEILMNCLKMKLWQRKSFFKIKKKRDT